MVVTVNSIRYKQLLAESYHVYCDNPVLAILSRSHGYLDCQCTGPLIVHGNKGKPSTGFEPTSGAAHYGTFKF